MTVTILVVHRDDGVVTYWSARGWTTERSEALEFATFSDANLSRNRARMANPGMSMVLEADDDGGQP